MVGSIGVVVANSDMSVISIYDLVYTVIFFIFFMGIAWYYEDKISEFLLSDWW